MARRRMGCAKSGGFSAVHCSPPFGMWFACASAAGLPLASAVGLHAYFERRPW
jgi:hypothetical protein